MALGRLAASGAMVIASETMVVAAWGCARRFSVKCSDPGGAHGVLEALGAVEVTSEEADQKSRPVVCGAMAFDPGAASDLILPALSVSIPRQGGTARWITTHGGEEDPSKVAEGLARFALLPRSVADGLGITQDPGAQDQVPDSPWGPDSFELRSQGSHDEFCQLVQAALGELSRPTLQKLVVARAVDVVANRPFLLDEVTDRLAALYPGCTLYYSAGFLGATPELLVSRHGGIVRSRPLAGTTGHSGDSGADNAAERALLASPKNRQEHSMVVEHVRRVLGTMCGWVSGPVEPSVVRLRNVSHLGTLVEARLDAATDTPPATPASALELAMSLHPTPAVAGVPTDSALGFIAACEKLDRGRYGGPVGWMDSAGDGEWWVAIRCAEVSGASARLYAGVGVVQGSDPREELAETQLKLQALLSALVRP